LAALLGWTALNVLAVARAMLVFDLPLTLDVLWIGGVWALACAMGSLFVPCSAIRAAARVDQQWDLKERFATAVELGWSDQADSPAAEVVYAQAAAAVGRLPVLGGGVWGGVRRAAAGWGLSVLLVAAMNAITVVPEGPAGLSPDQRREVAAVLRNQAATVDEELARKFEQAAGAVVALDDDEFDRLMDELREAGFRPVELTPEALRAAGMLRTERAPDNDATGDNGSASVEPGQPDIDDGSWMRVYHPDYDPAATGEGGDGPPPASEADYTEVWSAAKLRASESLTSGKVPAEYRRIVQRYFSDTSSE